MISFVGVQLWNRVHLKPKQCAYYLGVVSVGIDKRGGEMCLCTIACVCVCVCACFFLLFSFLLILIIV